jgi:hypothetical protein
MRELSKVTIVLSLIFILSFTTIIVGGMLVTNPKVVSAVLSRDEVELCIELNTYIEGPNKGLVDSLGLGICLAFLDDD